MAVAHLPAQHRGDLEVHQFRRAESLPAKAGASARGGFTDHHGDNYRVDRPVG